MELAHLLTTLHLEQTLSSSDLYQAARSSTRASCLPSHGVYPSSFPERPSPLLSVSTDRSHCGGLLVAFGG